MDLLTTDEAQELTADCHAVWVDAHHHAFDLWKRRLAEDPEFFKPLIAGDRASILHRHIFDYAARHLDGRVISTDALGFNAQIIDGRAMVRFKYLHRDLKPRAYRTGQQEHLEDQEFTEEMLLPLTFEGVSDPPTVLTCGYTLALGEDAVSRVAVVCWYRGELRYWYDIFGETAMGDGEVVPLFPSSPPDQPRVVSKLTKKEAEQDDERGSS
jgi:hypothetical protein